MLLDPKDNSTNNYNPSFNVKQKISVEMSEIERATAGDVVNNYNGMPTIATPGGYLGGELENNYNSVANLNIHGGSTTTITTIVTQSEGRLGKSG